jgi:hypothetical protein
MTARTRIPFTAREDALLDALVDAKTDAQYKAASLALDRFYARRDKQKKNKGDKK